jgi:hypothetical protein
MPQGPLGAPRPFGIGPFTKPDRRVKEASTGEIERAYQRMRSEVVDIVRDEMGQKAGEEAKLAFIAKQDEVVRSVDLEACMFIEKHLKQLNELLTDQLEDVARGSQSIPAPDQTLDRVMDLMHYTYYPSFVNEADCSLARVDTVADDMQRFSTERQFAPPVDEVGK